MKTINLINKEKSDIKYDIFKFNDGEIHIKFIDDIPHKDEYRVITRIKSMDELFILMQVGNILERHGVEYSIHITYLIGMRMDRVMTFNEAFSLEIIANMINTLHYKDIYIFEPHSQRTLTLINRSSEGYPLNKCNNPEYDELMNSLYQTGFVVVCFPDKGAASRYENDLMMAYCHSITLGKTRDVETGAITGMEFIEKPNFRTDQVDRCLIIDDLCDGGRTFIEAHKLLKHEYPYMPIDIYVKHMVNPKGLENLKNTFDHVYITDSYDDYESHDNVTVFKCYE